MAATDHGSHGGGGGEHGDHAAQFRDRFWLSLALTVPVEIGRASCRERV